VRGGVPRGGQASLLMSEPAMLAPLATALTQCLAIVAVGLACRLLAVLSPSDAAGLSAFVGRLSMPALLFLAMAELEPARTEWRLLLALCAAKVIAFVATIAITYAASAVHDRVEQHYSWLSRAGLYTIFVTQSNDFALGVPLCAAIWGDRFMSIIFLVAPFQLALLNPLAFVLLERGAQSEAGLELPANGRAVCGMQLCRSMVKVARSPLVLSVFLGGALRLCLIAFGDPPLPAIVHGTLLPMKQAFTATALVTLGLSLRTRAEPLMTQPLTSLSLLCAKGLAMPLLTRVLAEIFGVTEANAVNFAFLYGMLPSAPTVVVFAREFRQRSSAEYLASILFVGLILSVPMLVVSTIAVELPHSSSAAVHSSLRRVSQVGAAMAAISAAYIASLLICPLLRLSRLPSASIPTGGSTSEPCGSAGCSSPFGTNMTWWLLGLSLSSLVLAATVFAAQGWGACSHTSEVTKLSAADKIFGVSVDWVLLFIRGQTAALAVLMAQQRCPERAAHSTPTSQRSYHALTLVCAAIIPVLPEVVGAVLPGPSVRVESSSCGDVPRAKLLSRLALHVFFALLILGSLAILRLAPTLVLHPSADPREMMAENDIVSTLESAPGRPSSNQQVAAHLVEPILTQAVSIQTASGSRTIMAGGAGDTTEYQATPRTCGETDGSSREVNTLPAIDDVESDRSTTSMQGAPLRQPLLTGHVHSQTAPQEGAVTLSAREHDSNGRAHRADQIYQIDEGWNDTSGAMPRTESHHEMKVDGLREEALCDQLYRYRVRLCLLLLHSLLSIFLSCSIEIEAVVGQREESKVLPLVPTGVQVEVLMLSRLVEVSSGTILLLFTRELSCVPNRMGAIFRLVRHSKREAHAFPLSWVSITRVDSQRRDDGDVTSHMPLASRAITPHN